MKKKLNSRGFTLIEILTVIGILGVIGSIVVSVISLTLRGTKKSDMLEFARQNGDTALSQMVKSIRYAKSLDAPNSCVPTTTTQSVTVTSLVDDAQTTLSCANGTISSNSASLIDTAALSVSACSFVCTQTTLYDAPTISIYYTLAPKTAGSFTETNFTLPFQSSVTLRNYRR